MFIQPHEKEAGDEFPPPDNSDTSSVTITCADGKQYPAANPKEVKIFCKTEQ